MTKKSAKNSAKSSGKRDKRGGRGSGTPERRARGGGRDAAERATSPPPSAAGSTGAFSLATPGSKLLVFAAFALVALVVYGPALDGTFISDDEHYVQRNVWVHDPLDNWFAIFDPTSVLAVVIENYAPVHVLLHAIEWQFFDTNVRGYHVVNVLFHALASLLLVLLFMRSGISRVASLLGGAFFLVHPANVEAVAWINQLKSSSAMVLCVGALLAHPRRPAMGAVLFALALLAKPPAAAALFVAAAFGWVRRKSSERADASGDRDWKWGWLIAWGAILVLFAIAEFSAFGQTAGRAAPLYEDLPTRFRSIFAIGLRYIVMATSSFGLSAFHEPPPADTLDPWWLCSLVVFGALGWRTILALRDRREEAAYWLFAVVSFGPISGLIPLPFPLADRYLYFILPGLIGGCLLAGPALLERAAARFGRELGSRGFLAVRIIAVLWIAAFAVRSFDRAFVWQNPFRVTADAERNYPDGTAAKTSRATRAAQVGDADTAVALLREAHERGYNRLDHLLMEHYGPIESVPVFVELKKEWAREMIARLSRNETPSQHELRLIAQAQIVLGDLVAAQRAVERAIEIGGPITESLHEDLEQLGYALRMSRLRRN